MEGRNIKTVLNITMDENYNVTIDCPNYKVLRAALSAQLGFDFFKNNKKELFNSLSYILMNVVSMDKSGLLENKFIEVFKKNVPKLRKKNERVAEEINQLANKMN